MKKKLYNEFQRLRKMEELALFRYIAAAKATGMITTREIIEYSGIPDKRVFMILSKWVEKGYYNYGVSLYAGWLEITEEEFINKLGGI